MAPSFHRRRNRQRSVVRHNVTAAETTSNLSYQEHSSLRRLNIAVCLVGQFIRHGRLEYGYKDEVWQPSQRLHCLFDDLNSAWETEPNDLVDEVAECNALLERGFTSCVPICFLTTPLTLYTNRTNSSFRPTMASFLFVLLLCFPQSPGAYAMCGYTAISILSGNASLQSSDSTSAFDAIIVTRMDTINHISRVGITEGKIADASSISTVQIGGTEHFLTTQR